MRCNEPVVQGVITQVLTRLSPRFRFTADEYSQQALRFRLTRCRSRLCIDIEPEEQIANLTAASLTFSTPSSTLFELFTTSNAVAGDDAYAALCIFYQGMCDVEQLSVGAKLK